MGWKPSRYSGLLLGTWFRKRGADHSETAVQPREVLAHRHAAGTLRELVAVEEEPPDVVGPGAQRLAGDDRVDERLDQPAVEGLGLVHLGHLGSCLHGVGHGGVGAGVVHEIHRVEPVRRQVPHGGADHVFVHPGLDHGHEQELVQRRGIGRVVLVGEAGGLRAPAAAQDAARRLRPASHRLGPMPRSGAAHSVRRRFNRRGDGRTCALRVVGEHRSAGGGSPDRPSRAEEA